MRRAKACRALIVVVALGGCGDDPDAATTTATSSTTSVGGGGAGGGGGDAGGGTGGSAGCENSLPTDEAAPETLSATGLYADIASKTLTATVQPFEPQYLLWSDGADKERWVYLPECGQIDSSDMNDWSFPVGTRFWKAFTVGGVLVETRLVERNGPGPNDFIMAAYLWNDDETDATFVPDGLADARGTTHDIPSQDDCHRCHGSHAKGGGRPSRALGFSALQLSHQGPGVTLASLDSAGALTDAPAANGYVAPGDAVASAALGYLHANCGNCHNDTADGVPQVDLHFWLRVDDAAVEDTDTWLTAVDVAPTIFNIPAVTARIEPGDPAASAVHYRMSERGNNAQMPPLASETSDATGTATVDAWIASLPPTP
jgi:hypothetical protein